MEHLFANRVTVYRQQSSIIAGQMSVSYAPVSDLTAVDCRLDLNFLRPGRDMLPIGDAGRAPDRFGVAYFSADVPLKAGDVLQCIPGDDGSMPVSGWFDVRARPDQAIDYASQHHQEFQIIEIAQAVAAQIGPSQS